MAATAGRDDTRGAEGWAGATLVGNPGGGGHKPNPVGRGAGAVPATVMTVLPVTVLSAVSLTVSAWSPGVTRVTSPRPVSEKVWLPASSGVKV
jgi:hypothetical protein